MSRIATSQRGLITRQQLIHAGVARGAIDHRVASGRLHRIHRGVYLVGHRALPPLARELAAILACGPGAVLSHQSAAGLWRLGPTPESEVDVSYRARLRSRPGLRVHHVAAPDRRDLTRREGIPVTTPLRTLLDLAATAERRTTDRALAEALARSLVRRTQVLAKLDREPGHRGAATLRQLLESGPALTRSKAEERLLALVRRADLPKPEANARVGRYEVDALWREQRLAVEIDGYAFHSSPAAFEADRRRDADLGAAGLRVMRVTWRQVTDEPVAVAARLAAGLARSPSP